MLKPHAKYRLESDGRFVIEDYNQSKPFSSFFPGIAGVWGVPLWAFYVNRGQCIASFGVESKDKAIMEFQPANKAYRLTSLQGFRTFIKAKAGSKTAYWEPFQTHLEGTDFKKRQTMTITAHDLTLREDNDDLGLAAEVNYFTLPGENYSALVRRVTIRNTGKKSYDIELVDGLPGIVPYGLTDSLNKNISRTVEAWVRVRNLSKNAPFYQLKVKVADTPEVTGIEEGNFFFSFDPAAKGGALLPAIVEAASVFGSAQDFLAPARFRQETFKLPERQQVSNRTPSAMSHARFTLPAKKEKGLASFFGYAHNVTRLNKIVRQAVQRDFVRRKAEENKAIIDGLRRYALTKSSSAEFDLYASQTFLDNIMRGGLPVSLKTGEGIVAFNVFSRKHGDLERDYNHFVVKPTFFSQGNGNYRDVNQNRRNDVWFNEDVRSSHLITFLNLSQADGYNPLVVKGAAFLPKDQKKLGQALAACLEEGDRAVVGELVKEAFMPGDLLQFIANQGLKLKVPAKVFLGRVLETCQKMELADEGEGFWTDHWTYNLDLIESYLSVYPDDLRRLLLKANSFYFFHNSHHVLPREQRYILTARGVRQYRSVDKQTLIKGNQLRTKHGQGEAYRTNLICKLLCLIANKAASLDPSGIGIEMEADKPNWFDAFNGLPGLLGSSVSETFELLRLSQFLQQAMQTLDLPNHQTVAVFEELANFISGLTHVLSLESDAHAYWQKANDLKEHYRAFIREGIDGKETDVRMADIKNFLKLVIDRCERGAEAARNGQGYLETYFYHEVVEHEEIDRGKDAVPPVKHIKPLKFKKHSLPLFLEGYVHALRIDPVPEGARKLYAQVRKSGLYDRALKMYKVCADLTGASQEVGRARIFPPGWLENESIWLHMEYKFILELLRSGLYEEFYENFRSVLIPFLNAEQYGRSILENSSFLVSSVHEDPTLHGQGFVARLSGSTAEFMHMWLLMNMGPLPFSLDSRGQLQFVLRPILAGWLFTSQSSNVEFMDLNGKLKTIELPKNIYAFNLFASTLVVYHNPRRKNTFGEGQPVIKEIHLHYPHKHNSTIIPSGIITAPYAQEIRDRKIERIDVFFN
ncbi:MAG: hypothetical protein A3C36_06725 [Omnitrophica WOR_2 bacterium RIFCSPHIGHO2_02_FULL_52_10]|nr:MAG: hypothetical protein A3C36_06725 [Omnitrophica WOR_2 bacterium RIFCSPHIGHO2_02_FULL_52_10]